MKRLTLLFLLTLAPFLFAQYPKRELRGAWIATVTNLDWPSTAGGSTESQKAELIAILDRLKAAGINAVVFQIRTECDALYASPYDPWSYWLTGQQGKAPSPFYDPLQFAVEETHKRGMELHAWFNPYRAYRQTNTYPVAPNHVTVLHPSWVITCPDKYKLLNPGIPEVRDYVTMIIMDVVRRYDVDAVHFDDYFYPYPEHRFTNQDDSSFAVHNRGYSKERIGDWRRENVNLLIQQVHDSVQLVKQYVKVGMSPFGIWRNGTPPGITGLDAYNDIYCDAVAWLNQKIIDYVTPQLYWRIGGGQDFSKLMPWWESVRNGRHLYTGQAPYQLSPNEIANQIRLNRNNGGVSGSLFFRANFIAGDLVDTLKSLSYRYPSLIPSMAWKDSVPPNPPRNLRYESGASGVALRWDTPLPASDNDTAARYAIYRFDHLPSQPSELSDVRNIVALQGEVTSQPPIPPTSPTPYYYVVTALDRNYNESSMSPVVAITPAPAPTLAFPANGDTNQAATGLSLRWNRVPTAAWYRIQISTDPNFAAGVFLNDSTMVDTFRVVNGLLGWQKYFWRVGTRNAGGDGAYSDAYSFTTGLAVPPAPLVAYPAYGTLDVPTNPTFVWHPARCAATYQLQVSTSAGFTTVAVDASGLTDTTFHVSQLYSNTIYNWRVMASNALGSSDWSILSRFRTIFVSSIAGSSEIPANYELSQNYPNPFNPTTQIRFALPLDSRVELKIYDILGREVIALVSGNLHAGFHLAFWNARNGNGQPVPTGVYFCRLVAIANNGKAKFVESNKMILMR